MKANFHKKNFALRLALKRRQTWTRKWPISELLWFCITSRSDWFKVLAPLFQPIRSETKTNRSSRVHIFPRFVSATCNYFEFWLDYWIVSVLFDWPKWLLWFWFYDTHLKTALSRIKTKRMANYRFYHYCFCNFECFFFKFYLLTLISHTQALSGVSTSIKMLYEVELACFRYEQLKQNQSALKRCHSRRKRSCKTI